MRLALIMLAAFAVAGCASNVPKLVQKTDPYNGKLIYAFGPLYTNDCPGQKNGVYGRGVVSLSFRGADELHALNVTYAGYGWFFLNTALPMDILIDGKSSQLTPINSPKREVGRGGQVSEDVYYPVTKDFVQKLITAKHVQFRILGNRGALEQCLQGEILATIQAVVPLVP